MSEFTFRNADTGETLSARGHALNQAARSLGLDVPFRGRLPSPWAPWEYWAGGRCIWHCTLDGQLIEGPRP